MDWNIINKNLTEIVVVEKIELPDDLLANRECTKLRFIY